MTTVDAKPAESNTTLDPETTGVVVVDHGSRREESNAMLVAVAEQFARDTGFPIVEPAHMELAEPTIAAAFQRCVERGARRVVVFPYFLGPGRHWREDIPRLAAEAAAQYPHVPFLVAAPLGLHPLMSTIMRDRIEQCVGHAEGRREHCDVCAGEVECRFRG